MKGEKGKGKELMGGRGKCRGKIAIIWLQQKQNVDPQKIVYNNSTDKTNGRIQNK